MDKRFRGGDLFIRVSQLRNTPPARKVEAKSLTAFKTWPEEDRISQAEKAVAHGLEDGGH